LGLLQELWGGLVGFFFFNWLRIRLSMEERKLLRVEGARTVRTVLLGMYFKGRVNGIAKKLMKGY
jgi:hypothetical protein